MKQIRNNLDKVFNENGQLCEELLKFIRNNLDPAFISNDYNIGKKYSWREDIHILGDYHIYYYGKHSNAKDGSLIITFPSFPKEFNITALDFIEVRKWLQWVTDRIFNPEVMIYDTTITNKVNLRIAVSKLDKLNLPKEVIDHIFDNLISQYYTRKKVYTEYYLKFILELPF